jgi:hypothetical protein
MRAIRALTIGLVGVGVLGVVGPQLHAQNPKPTVQVPQPGVPQIMTLEGKFVRVAYNNEGYVIMGYQVSNRSIGEPWMLLEVGMTIMDRVPSFTLKREAISLDLPDGKNVPLPSIEEYRNNNSAVQALQTRSRVQRDSINYFPPSARQACRLGFFSDADDRAMPWDQVELSSQRGCVGRLYFPIPGGIAYGQHWLNVKFPQSLVRVPFRILTADEEKLLSKNFGDIKKQVDNAFRKKS